MISGTIEPMGTTLAGQNIESFYISLEHLKPISVGLNCATGPEFMRDHIRTLSEIARTAVSCYPNAGLPDEDGHYHESPESLAKKMAGFAEQGWLNIAGGCCGTTPEHIRALAETLKRTSRARNTGDHPPAVSGIETVYAGAGQPADHGRRADECARFAEIQAADRGRQIRRSGGNRPRPSQERRACASTSACRTRIAMKWKIWSTFCNMSSKKVKAPLMIDSTDADSHRARTEIFARQGDHQLDQPGRRRRKIRKSRPAHPPIRRRRCRRHDRREADRRSPREDKLEVAKRSYDLLVNKYGMNPQDIIFDPLVFPVGTGDEQYIGSAKETIEGIRMIKEAMPECQTILGISNVSFGLPAAGREVFNSVYLYHCTKAGLDYAIVNTEKLERYASIPEEERELAEELIFDTNDETLAASSPFTARKKSRRKKEIRTCRSKNGWPTILVEGTKEGLFADLDEALKKYKPLDIINGPLMDGMAEVGRLFNNNELIVAEVLQSAEVDESLRLLSGTAYGKDGICGQRQDYCSQRSKATCTISAKTWSRSFCPTTATKSSISASKCRRNS